LNLAASAFHGVPSRCDQRTECAQYHGGQQNQRAENGGPVTAELPPEQHDVWFA
jgi:hypothetical protein